VGAAVVPPLPWYRRLFRRQPRTYAANDRPAALGAYRAPRRTRLWLVVFVPFVLIAVLVGAYLGSKSFRMVVDIALEDVACLIPDFAHVCPGQGIALLDTNDATWWEGSGESPEFMLRFREPRDIEAFKVWVGADETHWSDYSRPRALRLVVNGEEMRRPIRVTEASGEQTRSINRKGVTTLRVIVVRRDGDDASRPVAIRKFALVP
jgi:hypothetical protein